MGINKGFVLMHRALIEWEWYKTPNMVQVFLHFLLKANHKAQKWQGIDVIEGSFISGRHKLSYETGLSQQSIRTCIKRLISTNELTIKTTTKYTVFTINSWKKYQSKNQSTSKLTNEQPTTNQQLTTNNNVNNVNNVNNNTSPEIIQEITDIIDLLNRETKKSYKSKTVKTRKLINARMEDGYGFNDFEIVIQKKVAEWTGTEYEKYLCPDTLFGSKFEKYLQQTGNLIKPAKQKSFAQEQDDILKNLMEGTQNDYDRAKRMGLGKAKPIQG